MAGSDIAPVTHDELLMALNNAGIDVEGRSVSSAKEVVDGLDWESVDKKELVGRPFVIVGYSFNASKDFVGDNGRPAGFVVVRLLTEKGDKKFFTDGSTGIYRQLKRTAEAIHGFFEDGDPATDLSKDPVIVCDHGLRLSEYTVNDERGKPKKSSTYYIG